jgi:hypothetical protein
VPAWNISLRTGATQNICGVADAAANRTDVS